MLTIDRIRRVTGPAATLTDVEGVLRGYIYVWGDPDHRDAYETWFDRARPPDLAIEPGAVTRPISYEHAQDGVVRKDKVGDTDRVWYDDTGLAFVGHLDRSSPFFDKLVGELAARELFTSSATMDHTADFYDDGAFKTWWLGELALTKTPAEPRMPATQLVRSGSEEARDALRPVGDASLSDISTQEDTPMDPTQQPGIAEALQQLLGQYSYEELMAALMQFAPPAEMSAPTLPAAPSVQPTALSLDALRAALERNRAQQTAADVTALRAEIAALRAAQNEPPVVETARRATGGSVSVSEPRKYWNLNANAALFAHQVMRSQRITPSDEFLTVLGARALKEIEANSEAFTHPAVRSLMPHTTRANEIATSTAATGGDEWVGVAYSGNLWEKARDEEHYQELVQRGMMVEEVPQGSESVYIPLESSDPTVYTITQPTDLDATSRPTVNVAATRIATDRKLVTPSELGMAVAWTDVFDEDSIIRVASQYNTQMENKARETVFQLFLNGDTATSLNVNYDGGTPGTGLSTPYYIASDGARKYALVTGSGTSRDGGAIDENDYRLTQKLLPSTVRSRYGQQVFFIDPDTHSASLDIAAIKTEDVKRTNATIVSGLLKNIWGVDVFQTGFLPLTASDGKVTYNAAGTLGTILLVYAPFWAVAWKRQLTMETGRDPWSSTNYAIAKMRIAYVARGAGAAVASYNLTV